MRLRLIVGADGSSGLGVVAGEGVGNITVACVIQQERITFVNGKTT